MSKIIDKQSVLSLFVEEPSRKFNVREAGRASKITPSSASKYLGRLHREGLLVKKKDRNMVLYSADTESPAFKDFKIYYNVREIRASGLIGFMEKELNFPEAIMLFGSYAKGENTERSDIDLFVASESRKTPDFSFFEKKLGAKIQVFIFNRQKIEKIKADGKELLNNIINGVRLTGFFEVFR